MSASPVTAARRPVRLPRAVIFDMDGLILDTEVLGERTWELAARTTGITFDLALLPSMIGRNHRDTRAFLTAHYGDDYPAERLTAACLVVFDEIIATEGLALKPGVVELLDWLDEHRIARAVATSTRRERAVAQLTGKGLYPRFHALVGGNEVRNGKPAPDIFLEASARLGVPCTDCVVLEDSEPGVRAAIASGIAPIMVPDILSPSPEILAFEPLVMESLVAVRSYLASLPRVG